MKFINWGFLGRDFWLFRFGQVMSVIGDSCGNIAMAWWILEETGSAAKMASIIAPAMFVRIFLLPLFGPIGDKFPRKWLIIIGDVWRGLLTVILAAMVFFHYFNLPLLITLYILMAIGTSLFQSVVSSIVPQLVTKDKLQKAMQQEQAIMASGSVVGGIAGGLFVTIFGIGGAFLIDATSYFLAAIASFMIKANTKPPAVVREKKVHAIVNWFQELKEGFSVVVKIPIEFWLAIVAALMNFVVSPIGIALPVLVKEARNMPPWFLGALESSVSIGSIIGALTVGWLCRKMLADFVVVLGIVIIGLGIAILPWIPNPSLPLSMMLFIGIGSMLANIPLHTQMALAMPDEYRSRAGSVIGFICQLASPLGVAFAGIMISNIGLNFTMLVCGGLLILLSPLLFLIPKFSEFLRLPPEKAHSFYRENYSDAFRIK